jgi:DNA-binding GntR family transcriptional regulator
MLLTMSEGPSSRSVLAADLAGEAPLYQQCLRQIADEIRSGRLSPGTRLQSERALAVSLGYTRLTVRRSLHELARQGLIEPAGTRGWQVRDTPFSEPPNTLMSFTELARSRGLTASARPLNLVEREATVDEADQLRIAPGSLIIECTRLRCMDDEPIAIETLRLSLSRFPWLTEVDWNGSVHDALSAHRAMPARANVFVDVVAADADQSEILQLSGSQHLLRVTSTTSDADGVPLSLDEIAYHPHRYRFHAVLTKPVGEVSS